MSASSALRGEFVHIFGDLELKQKIPFEHWMTESTFTSDRALNLSAVTSFENLNFISILKNVNDKPGKPPVLLAINLFIVYMSFTPNITPLWRSGAGNTISIEGTINVKDQEIRYRPWIWETLKVAFVQYYPLFVIVRYVILLVLGWFIAYGLINTRLVKTK